MRKAFRLTELDCASCAAKLEAGIARLDGVKSVTVNFITQKMTLEAEDTVFEAVLERAVKAVKRIEPGCRVCL